MYITIKNIFTSFKGYLEYVRKQKIFKKFFLALR